MNLRDKFTIFYENKTKWQLVMILGLLVGSLVLLGQLVRLGTLLIIVVVFVINFIAINSFQKVKLDVLYKHKNKLQLGVILLVMFLVLVLLWQLVHFWILVIALLAIVNIVIFISYQKDMAVPFVESFLAKEYLRIKAKRSIKSSPLLAILRRQYQAMLQHLLILFLDSQKSFELLLWDNASFDIKFDSNKQTLDIKTKEARNKQNEAFFDFYKLRKKKLIALSLGASTGLVLTIVFLVFIIPSWHKLNASTYGWIQTDWSTGISTTSVAVHPGDKINWAKFFSASANLLFGLNLRPDSVINHFFV